MGRDTTHLTDEHAVRVGHTAAYAWIVDRDTQSDPDDPDYRVGTTGPSDAPEDLLDMMRRAGPLWGRCWRTKYEPGEDPEHRDIVHEGRILTVDPDDMGSEYDFGPLWDLSGPDCGAVIIEYRQPNGSWEQL